MIAVHRNSAAAQRMQVLTTAENSQIVNVMNEIAEHNRQPGTARHFCIGEQEKHPERGGAWRITVMLGGSRSSLGLKAGGLGDLRSFLGAGGASGTDWRQFHTCFGVQGSSSNCQTQFQFSSARLEWPEGRVE